jgi:hypothetical protein
MDGWMDGCVCDLIWVQLGSSKRGGNTNQFDGKIDPTAD